MKIFYYKRILATVLFLFLAALSWGLEGKLFSSALDFSWDPDLTQDENNPQLHDISEKFRSAFSQWYNGSGYSETGKSWVITAGWESPPELSKIQVSILHLTINGYHYTAPLSSAPLREKQIQALFNSWIPELREDSDIPIYLPRQKRQYSIMIDPGHGGRDSGAVSSRGIMEKELNGTLSALCAEELKKQGFKVSFSRDPLKDEYLSLPGRERASLKINPDLVISLHHDSTRDKSVKGFSVFYGLYQPHRDRKDIKARVDRKDVLYIGELILDERTHLIYKTAAGVYGYATSRKNIWRVWDESPGNLAAQCKNIANTVHTGLEKLNYTEPARGKARSADFFLLRRMGVPVILIEAGYVSNDTEVLVCRDPENQKQFAENLGETLKQYFYGGETLHRATGK